MTTFDLPLTRPLHDVAAWVRCFSSVDIPVFADTAEALEGMRANEDDIDANILGEMIAGDPLMSLKVLAYVSTNRSKRMITDTPTVTASIVMLGISPFFRIFGQQPTVEERLQSEPQALAGLQRVVQRSHRAARFALGFGVHRADPNAAMLYSAALLHDFAEMLLWCHAPSLALAIATAQQLDPTLRSSAIQKRILNVELVDLQHELMLHWRLPEILVRINDDRQAHQVDVQSVALAIQLARHTTQGWDNAAVPDDVRAAARLLNLSETAAEALLREIDA